MEKRGNKVKISKKDIMSCESDKPVHERSKLSLQQFTEISRLDNNDLYTVHGDKKVNTSCMPKLTVKDLSRILCPSLSDNKEMRCRDTASPNTSGHGLNHQFSNLFITKDLATIRRNSLSLSCSSGSVVQQRHCYRTLSLCPSELHQSREGKMIDTSPGIELRERATTWSPRQSMTLISDQNDNTSKNLDQVCTSLPLQL